LQIARELLGKHLYTNIDGVITAGRVVETEAYRHEGDNSLTMHLQRKRNQAQGLHVPGGQAYIYTVYNRYALFNIATHDADHPDAVLIRAVEPTIGIPEMLARRGLPAAKRALTAGPGVMSQALGITPALTGLAVTGEVLWFEDHGETVADADVVASARVGLEYAGLEAAGLPWRFRVRGNSWTSPAK
jgi:DNA-3-methyladenine glycosylase